MAVNTIKEDEQLKEVIKITTILRLLSYMKKYKKGITGVLLLMTLIIGVSIINPLLMRYAVDNLIPKGNVQGTYILALAAIGVNIIAFICIRLRIITMTKISNKVLMEIRQELYEHIQKLSFAFFDDRPVGKILARVVGDVNSLKDILTNSVITLIPDFVTVLSVLIIMTTINYKLALAAVALLPLLILGMYLVQVRSHKKWQVFRKKNSNLNAFVHEDFSGIRVVQSFTAEETTSKAFGELLEEHRGAFFKAVRLNDFFWPMVELSWGAGTVLVFSISIWLLKTESVSVGTIIAFVSYLSMFWQPIMNLSNFYTQLLTNLAGAERIFEIMDTVPQIVDEQNAHQMPKIKGAVTFENVSFSYDGTVQVLKNIQFKVRPGETIALVGPTGAGKTTVVNLISRFYDITEGKITIDGHNIKEVTIESLRSQMGIMTQDTFLFSGTIKDNIRYGRLDATDEEVIRAAEMVHAHEFIMRLPEGYDSKVNERGTKLSSGQRQLLAFARTMLSNPRILILDEATSSIDTRTERLVQKGIDEIIKNRTSFVVAHRLSTIQKADRIFVIEDGIISEEGSHDQLLLNKGHYYKLYMSQFKELNTMTS